MEQFDLIPLDWYSLTKIFIFNSTNDRLFFRNNSSVISYKVDKDFII
jgi:hypothetical protein